MQANVLFERPLFGEGARTHRTREGLLATVAPQVALPRVLVQEVLVAVLALPRPLARVPLRCTSRSPRYASTRLTTEFTSRQLDSQCDSKVRP